MRHLPCRLPLLCLLMFLSACSGDKSSPAAPAPIPALPNYTGIWSGTYVIASCTQNGTIAAVNVCGTFTAGTPLPFVLNVAQGGTTAGSSIQGNFTLGTIPFNIAPTTITSSTLTLSGTTLSSTLTILVTWNLTAPIVGTQTQVWSSSGLTGQVNISSQIGSVSKTGSVRAPVAGPTSVPDLLRQLQE
jgi:hypothetical protein